jgi:hypothetical protein
VNHLLSEYLSKELGKIFKVKFLRKFIIVNQSLNILRFYILK